jgi:uncharacterized protein YqhQ
MQLKSAPASPAPCAPRQLDLAIGGQAVIEGVMMRSPTAVATAVRNAAGRIVVRKRPFRSIVRRVPALGVPVLRGGVHLVESLAIGLGALTFAADQAADDGPVAQARPRKPGETLLMWGTLVLSFVLGLGLFFYLPLVLTGLLGIEHSLWFNLVDGLFRIVIFVAYLWGISRLPDMARVFQYHGAEHKTIHAFENGRELTPAGARPFTTLHPRCGTSFLFFVMLISVVVFVFLGRPDTVGARLLRLAFVPLISGLAYEAIKLSGRFRGAPALKPLIWPGLMLQRITTNEPDDAQLEVAMAALRAVLAPEEAGFRETTWEEPGETSAPAASPGREGAP